MPGIISSVLGGILITLQGVFSTRISSKIGLWETNAIMHLAGLVLTVIFLVIWGDGNFAKLNQVNGYYLPGLCFGTLVVFSTITGISYLGPSWATTILLITQLVVATTIDCCGLFETTPVKFHFTKPLGIGIMIAGIIIFKLTELCKTT
jgi:transporter family-2 protein